MMMNSIKFLTCFSIFNDETLLLVETANKFSEIISFAIFLQYHFFFFAYCYL